MRNRENMAPREIKRKARYLKERFEWEQKTMNDAISEAEQKGYEQHPDLMNGTYERIMEYKLTRR